MREVFISGVGMTAVGEHWDRSLRELALEALEAARRDGPPGIVPEALFVSNMLSGQLSRQEHLGALIADFAGLRGIEAVTVEAAGASGGAALRQAVLSGGSGMASAALVVGVEKMTDTVGPATTAAVASAGDSDWESAQGATSVALAAMLMQRYMHEHKVELQGFAGFSVNAHANGKANPRAMFRNVINEDAFVQAGMVSSPVTMFDSAPEADGAAALLVTAVPGAVRVAGSAMSTDTLALHDRPDPLVFEAARESVLKALGQAGVTAADVDVFELFDAYTVFAALSLEAAGFAERGQACRLAQEGAITLGGRIPISTFGGLKARGNPGGATGVFQIAEVALQLRGEAGPNQIKKPARVGMAQCIGGAGATAATHVLVKAG
jgi:acetyl-CoA C-acetyltransferase